MDALSLFAEWSSSPSMSFRFLFLFGEGVRSLFLLTEGVRSGPVSRPAVGL